MNYSQAGTPTNSKMKDPVFKKDKVEHLFELERQYEGIIDDYHYKAERKGHLWTSYYQEASKPWIAKLDTIKRELVSILGPEYEPKKDVSVPTK